MHNTISWMRGLSFTSLFHIQAADELQAPVAGEFHAFVASTDVKLQNWKDCRK
jgi:hypothetical protein